MNTSSRKLPLLRPNSRLVAHEIQFASSPGAPHDAKLVATTYCERQRRTLEVEQCAFCDRFAHIKVHDAGYTMLCRSADEELGAHS